jgi:hypothetical protein
MLPFCCLACLGADTARAWLCLKFVYPAFVNRTTLLAQKLGHIDVAKNKLRGLKSVRISVRCDAKLS